MKTTGNSSGMAAAASVTALTTASSQPYPCRSRTPARIRQMIEAATSSTATRRWMAACSGVRACAPLTAERTISP